jgi:hypothetical protein
MIWDKLPNHFIPEFPPVENEEHIIPTSFANSHKTLSTVPEYLKHSMKEYYGDIGQAHMACMHMVFKNTEHCECFLSPGYFWNVSHT